MKNLAENIGRRMRRFRLAANLSQGELARISNLTKSYLSEVERGKVNISIANLDKIAEALGVPLSILLDCGDLPDRSEVLRELAELPDDVLAALYHLIKHVGHKPRGG